MEAELERLMEEEFEAGQANVVHDDDTSSDSDGPPVRGGTATPIVNPIGASLERRADELWGVAALPSPELVLQ